MQYCSLQHWTLLPSPVTSTTGCCFCFGTVSSFFLQLISPLISSSILGTYQPGDFIFQCPIFLPFHTIHWQYCWVCALFITLNQMSPLEFQQRNCQSSQPVTPWENLPIDWADGRIGAASGQKPQVRASLVAQTEESAYSVGDPGLIPGLVRCSGERNGNPLQYSCLGKSHVQKSLVGCSPQGHEGLDTTDRLKQQYEKQY